MRRTALAVALLACIAALAPHTAANACLGEYSVCAGSGECTLGPCGLCAAGQYLCPDMHTCVAAAADYVTCPGLRGTHLDWTLGVEEVRDRIALFF